MVETHEMYGLTKLLRYDSFRPQDAEDRQPMCWGDRLTTVCGFNSPQVKRGVCQEGSVA